VTGTMKRRSDLTVHDLGSEMILYDQSCETFHVLNATARQIWLWAEDDGVAEKLQGMFPEEDPARIQRDVGRALEQLGRIGLVELLAPSPAASVSRLADRVSSPGEY